MISASSVVPTTKYVEALRQKYGFQPKDGVLIPLDED